MANYYFLIAAFPPLTLGVKPDLSYKELNDLLVLNLTPEDLGKLEELLRPIDLYNIRAFWLGAPLDDRGQLKAKDLEEELLVQEALPDYIIEYLERYETTEDRLRYFSSLYASLYRDQQPKLKGFLLKYYQFERDLRLVLTGLRAKRARRDIVRELQFEDPTDPLIAEILAQKDAIDYTPPREYEDLKTLFVENSSEPKELNRAILEYRFNKIEEMEEAQDFGIDRVLAYVVKFMLAESLAELDNNEKGMEQLSQYE
jgi:hypothetical protein